MCCLFGMINYNHTLSRRQKTKIIRTLAECSEERGTDAAGIAYNSGGTLRIDKHPGAAHTLNFKVPRDSSVVMGHTRMTTQGSALKVQNNHPFAGNAHGMPFALAHNGTLCNDHLLRKTLKLPETNIETDSYIAVQLIEQAEALNFNSLRHMAEEVEGSFCFTVLDRKNNLYYREGKQPLLSGSLSGERAVSLCLYGRDFKQSPALAGPSWCGYDGRWEDRCLEEGFTMDEIEEFLYCGEL